MIPLARPTLDDAEIDAAARVLRSRYLVQGAEVKAFEGLLAERTTRTHAIAVSSGTGALELALRALGVREGDEVICPDLSWPSPAHAIALCGATPILVDVDLHEWNAGADSYARALSPKTRAAIVIDQFGNPARIGEIAEALGSVPVIEDAACALGSKCDSGPCGKLGAISCVSFHPRKVITTGEGGACLTDDPEIANRLRSLRNHGQTSPGTFVVAAGNYRLSEMHAAIGSAQMAKLDLIVERRRVRAKRYMEALPDLAWQKAPPNAHANYQTMGLLLEEPFRGDVRARLIDSLRGRGVEAGILSYAIHELGTVAAPPHPNQARPTFPNATEIASRGLAIPLFPDMTDAEQQLVIESLTLGLREVRP